MLNLFQDVSFFVILIVCVVAKLSEVKFKRENVPTKNWFLEKYATPLFFVILLICAITFSTKLSQIPAGLHVDEAGALYDAICLSKYGVDRYLNHLPVYLINFGGGQSALYAYFVAILIKIFGTSITVFRLPAVLLSLLSMICFYQMLSKHFGKKQGLLGVLILAVMPWNILKSRWGLDCNLLSSMMVISIYVFDKAIHSDKHYWYLLSGIIWGLTLYTYVISYLVVPVFLGFGLLYALWLKKVDIPSLICLAIPLGILALPLIMMLLYNTGILQNAHFPIFSIPKLWFYRGGEISLQNIPENLRNIFNILFIKDFLNYNTIPAFGTLYKMSIPLVLFGLLEIIKNVLKTVKQKELSLDLWMFLAFIITFVVGLCISELNINKLNAIYIPMIYFAGRFLYALSKNAKPLAITVVFLYVVHFAIFMHYYFTDFANTDLMYFENDILAASEKAESLGKSQIYVENQNYIYTLVTTPISPYEFNENLRIENGNVMEYGKYRFEIPQELNKNAVYIVKNEEIAQQLVNFGFEKEIFGELSVLWVQK